MTPGTVGAVSNCFYIPQAREVRFPTEPDFAEKT